MAKGSRTDQRRITVKVGSIDLGVMQNKSGGAVRAESTKTRPGGMEDEIDLGGVVSVEDVELAALFDLDFIQPKLGQLRALVGVQDQVVVTEQYLDRDKNAKGKPDVYRGSLAAVAAPDYDSDQTGEKAQLSITVSVSGPVG